MKVNIRYATKDDRAWTKKVLQEDVDARLRLNMRGSREGSVFNLNDTWSASFIAEVEKVGNKGRIEPVGFTTVSNHPLQHANSIDYVYVVEDYRKNGIATKLLDYAEKYTCQNWPARGVRILTIENRRMDKLLKKRGYKLMGRIKEWYVFDKKLYGQKCYFKEL